MPFLKLLRRAFGARSTKRGFSYIADEEPEAYCYATGAIVQIPGRGPPWLVVNHSIDSIIVARWPGRLWQVEILDPITKSEMADSPLTRNAGYTRAARIRVLSEESVATLFGQYGTSVCTVIAAVDELTLKTAARLAMARPSNAGEAQTRVWRRWLSDEGGSLFPDEPAAFDCVLSYGRNHSPVGKGLLVLSGQVGRRATATSGQDAWASDPDGEEATYLAEPWSGACNALLDAALAFGAADFVTESDRTILAKPWREVIGADPS